MSVDRAGYAVIYLGVIWGTGETPPEAIEEALLWLNGDPGKRQFTRESITLAEGWVDAGNRPYCVPCTQDLIDMFAAHGGDLDYQWNDEILDVS